MAPAIPPAQARMVWDADDDIVPLSCSLGTMMYSVRELTVAGSTMEVCVVWRWTALNIG